MLDFFSQGLPENFHMWFTMILIVGAILTYANDKISLEITSIVVLSILLVVFYLFPLKDPVTNELIVDTEKLLLGFANPALIAVISLLVLGQAVVQTGALNEVANLILKVSNNNATLSIGLSLIVVVLISALLNNTPVVVIFISILSALARNFNLSVSKVMIPLSYAAITGGMITLIGSSTNLLASGMLADMGMDPINFFDFTIPGLFMAGVAFVYILFIAPKLLKDRSSLVSDLTGDGTDKRQFIAQIDVDYTSELIGKNIENGHFPDFKDITIRMVQRGEHAFLPPFEDNMAIRAGDIVVLSATRKDISRLVAEKPDSLKQQLTAVIGTKNQEDLDEEAQDMHLAELVVAPASRMIGRNLEQISFHHTHDCVVLGIQRQSRVIRARVTEIRLAAGDVLLIMGKKENILALHSNKDVMLMEWSTEEIHAGISGVRAATIFFGVAGLAAFNILPITVSAFAGVGLVIITKCLNLRQAARAVDMNIILMVATSLALGMALQFTGGADYLAHGLIVLMEGSSPVVIMGALFFLMMLLTNVLSNNASAVLFTPIAVGVANELGVNPMMFVYAVIFACNCSFITPIGYQTNLLVMAPGHYRFSDFIKAGLPLGILMWATYMIFCLVWPEFFDYKL